MLRRALSTSFRSKGEPAACDHAVALVAALAAGVVPSFAHRALPSPPQLHSCPACSLEDSGGMSASVTSWRCLQPEAPVASSPVAMIVVKVDEVSASESMRRGPRTSVSASLFSFASSAGRTIWMLPPPTPRRLNLRRFYRIVQTISVEL